MGGLDNWGLQETLIPVIEGMLGILDSLGQQASGAQMAPRGQVCLVLQGRGAHQGTLALQDQADDQGQKEFKVKPFHALQGT